MSATLEDSTINHWEEAGILKNYIPPTDKEIREYEELSYELAKISTLYTKNKC